ncbi:unnamed protein product [Rotaria sp. Silwood1]|nr:unnamed protein product [Rotaria sp. Silwood1]
MTVALVSIVLFSSLVIIHGSHFLGGTISWHPFHESATGSPVAIVITQTYSWTYSLITCTTADITTNELIHVGSYTYLTTQTLDCISNCYSGAAGYVPPSVRPRCTDISAPLGTTVGQRSDIVYLSASNDFTAAFQQNAWRPLATALSASWSIATHIKVQPRSDNGLYNSAPVATMMSPIEIPVNRPTAVTVPVGDADGDTTRCRWSTSSNGIDECGGVCPPHSLPPNAIIYPNCTIIITGQTVDNWFAVAIMVEDFISPTSTTPLSAVPVQFLVHVVNSPSCTTEPVIAGIPLEDSCTPITVGQTFHSMLIAINHCGASVTIVDISTLSFSGMIKGDLIEFNTSTYYKTLSWTPTSSQLGYQVMCAMALNSQNAQSAQYCFKFYVSQNNERLRQQPQQQPRQQRQQQQPRQQQQQQRQQPRQRQQQQLRQRRQQPRQRQQQLRQRQQQQLRQRQQQQPRQRQQQQLRQRQQQQPRQRQQQRNRIQSVGQYSAASLVLLLLGH